MKLILWLSVVLALAVYFCGALIDPDLWWHITVGRWILAHRELPLVDYWNMFGQGKPWLAYSWSSEILLAFVEGRWGLHGLLVLKILLSLSFVASLFYVYGRLAGNWFYGALLGILASAACASHFTLRPQVITWIVLAWLMLLADGIVEKGASRSRTTAVFCLMCLWANNHLSAALGLFVFVCFLVGRASLPKVARAGIYALTGTFLTPYFGREWLTLFSKSGHPFEYASIIEFQPATILQHSTGMLLLILALLLVLLHYRPNLLSRFELLAGGVMTIGGLAVVKFLPYAAIVLCALIARAWRESGQSALVFGKLGEGLERFRGLTERLPRDGITFVFICWSIVSVYGLWLSPLNSSVIPVAAVDYILEQKLPHPILNDFGRGGYLMYRQSDAAGNLEHPVPLDGRTNVNSHEVWKKASDALNGRANWREYLEAVQPATVLWPTESPLVSILLAEGRWCRVFKSGTDAVGYSVLARCPEGGFADMPQK